MESMNHCLYSDLINHQDIQIKESESENQVEVNPNPSIQDTNSIDNNNHEEAEEEEKEDSKILRWNINPIPSSFSIECNHERNRNPKSVLEIISPKSTTTQFDSKPDPFEFFGQQRSQFIQRDLIETHHTKSSQSNLMVEDAQVQAIGLQVDQTPKIIKHEYDEINLTTPNLYDPINHQLDDLTQSFQNSTKLFHSDLTPIQSFKKFNPLRLHSRLMNQSSNPNEIPRSFLSPTQDLSLKKTDEMMDEFLSPSSSIEEENQKVKILISKEIQLSSSFPVLSIKGEPISNSIKSNPFTPILSRKRKPSDLLDESDYHHSSRIKISHHSKHLKLMNSSGNLSVPSLAELRATMPPSSRRYYHPIPSPTPTKQS